MKRTLTFVSVLFLLLSTAKAQNADPYISISMRPGSIPLGATTTLEVLEGNFAHSSICPNSLIITVSVGMNSQIMGIAAGSDARWTMATLTTGAGNTIRMTNSAGGFGDLDVGTINLIVKAVAVGGPFNCGANIAYIIDNNPCAGGAPNAIHGNLEITNDNSVSSLNVPMMGTLPLHFTGFSVKENSCNASVSWSTTDEQNVHHFDIQQSFDGSAYTTVKTVTSKGNGNNSYETVLPQGQKRMYYRVVGVDIDKRQAYGNVMALQLGNCGRNEMFGSVFPVPAKRSEKINIQVNVDGKITYRLMDLKGRVLQTGSFARATTIVIENSGTYLLELIAGSKRETHTIVIQ